MLIDKQINVRNNAFFEEHFIMMSPASFFYTIKIDRRSLYLSYWLFNVLLFFSELSFRRVLPPSTTTGSAILTTGEFVENQWTRSWILLYFKLSTSFAIGLLICLILWTDRFRSSFSWHPSWEHLGDIRHKDCLQVCAMNTMLSSNQYGREF